MNMPLLQISGLVTAYGKIEALKDVSLSLPDASITCLLGPNGAGKTTLMMTLAGLLRPRRGAIRFAGKDLAGQPPHQVVAHGITLVPENRQVFQKLSVRDNLRAGAYSRNDRFGIEADIARIFRRFPRLREREHQPAGTLSGGEQQMLALARGLMARPKLLLIDEPSLGLAPKMVAEVFRMIAEINAAGTSIFLVEQNVRMALQVARHVYLMEQGKIRFSGTPDQLVADQVVQRAYLGSARGIHES